MQMKIIKYTLLLLMTTTMGIMMAQDEAEGVMIDQVIGVIGDEIILQSDIEAQYLQYRMQEGVSGSESSVKCSLFENMLYQKLLLNQAELDSILVSPMQVEAEMDRRLRYFISQFGSPEKLEEFYKKTIFEIKDEFRDQITDQMKVERVQESITENTKVTPSEVKSFFKSIPKDSLPLINSEVKLAQIVKMPPISIEEKESVKKRLIELRNRVLGGENFSTLAILYSEDPGSAKNGGELGLVGRGELYKEFEAVAFSLKPDTVSGIVETEAGFHIIQLIERRGDFVNVRHILMQPKVSPMDLIIAKNELDSIVGLIEDSTYTFNEAVVKFSEDPSKNNGGLIINPMTGTAVFEVDQLDPKVFFVIDKLEIGDISKPVPYKMADGKDAYRVLYLQSRTEPHQANLKQDYDKMQEWALQDKKQKEIGKWIAGKSKEIYVKINDDFKDCDFINQWNN
jgi:peptidyl-prolyl cis-trans isomerase SurA